MKVSYHMNLILFPGARGNRASEDIIAGSGTSDRWCVESIRGESEKSLQAFAIRTRQLAC